MKNILVTGGLGFIGSNFIRLLMKDGSFETIINFDKQTYAGNPENLQDLEKENSYHFIQADICDGNSVLQALGGLEVDAVVNFAAESHVDRSIDGPEPFVQTNVVGTLSLLEAFKAYYNSQTDGRQEELRFLHVSTDEVYGSLNTEDRAFCETTPYAPNSPYSA
jgi:dTDP-glucose 4,6-dehydratase